MMGVLKQQLAGKTFEIRATPELLEAVKTAIEILRSARKAQTDSPDCIVTAWRATVNKPGKRAICIQIEEP